ncbi:MAG: hypothetical protein J7578_16815 [Chitinophagaceae bacterium]|nr:hypothetical protein [Chitinophagaceae bacterium]
MMMLITIPVNVFLLVGALVVAFLFGLMLRSRELAKSKRKVNSLETEMVSNHAEILNLQKENVELERKLKTLSIPVIPMTKEDKMGETKRVSQSQSSAQKHS